MDLLLKFFLLIVPEDAKIAFAKAFDNYRENPIHVVGGGINHIQTYFRSDSLEERAASVNGVMLGIFMAHGSKDSAMSEMLKGFLDQHSKLKGENIIDFQQMKILKRR